MGDNVRIEHTVAYDEKKHIAMLRKIKNKKCWICGRGEEELRGLIEDDEEDVFDYELVAEIDSWGYPWSLSVFICVVCRAALTHFHGMHLEMSQDEKDELIEEISEKLVIRVKGEVVCGRKR